MIKATSRTLLIASAMAMAFAGFALAGSDADEKGIEQAVQNYVSALYDMKPEFLDKSVSPKLQKVGSMPTKVGSNTST
jgi:hypothetical protein